MDVKFAFNGTFYDLVLANGDLATDAGLMTACAVSLFTDARAGADDLLPDNSDDRRGWWGDLLADLPGDRIGSKLWLLAREKALPEVAHRVETAAADSLQWLIVDGIARRIVCTATWVSPGACGLQVEIYRATGDPVSLRYSNIWEALHV